MNLMARLNTIALKAKKLKRPPLTKMDGGASGPMKMSGILNQAMRKMKLKGLPKTNAY